MLKTTIQLIAEEKSLPQKYKAFVNLYVPLFSFYFLNINYMLGIIPQILIYLPYKKNHFKGFYIYYNETRTQANIVVVIDVGVVHIAVVEVRVPCAVCIVLRRRPVVVANLTYWRI